MEFVLGACASVGATLFTNPLDVLKTKTQLQGELRAKGQYSVHYRNVFHAAYMVAKEEGVLALQVFSMTPITLLTLYRANCTTIIISFRVFVYQKGLGPALCTQGVLNGTRLGVYQWAEGHGYTRNKDGTLSAPKIMLISSLSGSLGAFLGSPFYMLKCQLQSQAPVAISKGKNIALGTQHEHKGMINGFANILQKRGFVGLFDGASGAVLRVSIGSCVQLTTFSYCKQFVEDQQFFSKDAVWKKACASSLLVGVSTALTLTPFDAVSTRLFNQPRDTSGKGLLYKGVIDCFIKTLKTEKIRGLYKGLVPVYTRNAPHSILTYTLWEKLKSAYSARDHESVK